MPLSDAWVDFLAGWCSGAVAVLAVQPVDTVLTRWQAGLVTTTTGVTAAAAASAVPAAAAAAATTTTTVRNMTRSLTQSFGYTALWRGSSPMIGAVPIQNALLMGGYGIGLQYADNANANDTADENGNSNGNNNHRYMAIFVGGCTGGVLQSFLMSPVELVKVSQQCWSPSPGGQSLLRNSRSTTAASAASLLPPVEVWNLTTHLLSTRAAWTTGLGATLLRDGIPHGVWFLAYEMCKQQMQNKMQQEDVDDDSSSSSNVVMVPLVSGAVAATTAWAVGYPADLIKTRIQARVGGIGGIGNSCSNSINLGIVGTAQQLIHEANGRVIAGLYRGFGLKLVRSVPASMIGFTTYEFVKKHIVESL